jgi:hypothetical protein
VDRRKLGEIRVKSLTQTERMAKISGWTNQGNALIMKAKIEGLAL